MIDQNWKGPPYEYGVTWGPEPEAYLRDVGTADDPCMVVCAKGDPGAIRYVLEELP